MYWLPLGVGERTGLVRRSGKVFEWVSARRARRPARDLYHSALQVLCDGERFVVEMTPVWRQPAPERGVVGEGPVGAAWLGRSRLFRYEVRCWRHGVLPDVEYAVASPQRLSTDPATARHLLDLVPAFPRRVWGRDEQQAGEMWNSNSLTAWLLARTGHDPDTIRLPPDGRAPGWAAGWTVARRSTLMPTEETPCWQRDERMRQAVR
ncbi:hypothetical protein V6U90_20490 [Micromonospora sp. CPCC 206060]|uniref:hypothetical protein n=1 Tax=Micromonospora sp. CPCC 206060 TaxID=3122406 RepID=UPI002FF398E3